MRLLGSSYTPQRRNKNSSIFQSCQIEYLWSIDSSMADRKHAIDKAGNKAKKYVEGCKATAVY